MTTPSTKRKNEDNVEEQVVELKKEKLEEIVESKVEEVKCESKVEEVKCESAEGKSEPLKENHGPKLGHGQDKGLFTSEIFKVELGPIPKMIGYGELKRFIAKSMDITAHKIKYVKQHRRVFICFKNDEERDSARQQLDGLQLKKETLVAKIAGAAQDRMAQDPKPKNDDKPVKVDLRTTKEKLLDVTAPWREIPYDKQVMDKSDKAKSSCVKITNLLKHATSYRDCPVKWPTEAYQTQAKISFEVQDCERADAVLGYRNKCEFSYGLNEKKTRMVGFRVGRYKDGTLTVESAQEVSIIRASMKSALVALEEHVLTSKFDPYCPAKYEGHWQTVMMRASGGDQDEIINGELMADHMAGLVLTFTFIRNDIDEEQLSIARDEVKAIAENSSLITGAIFVWKNTRGNDGETNVVYGNDLVTGKILGKTFEVSPSSFFQTHYHQCGKLYKIIGELGTKYTDPEKKKVLLDICCGTGSIGIALSDYFDKVFGIDIVEDAIKDAIKNVKLNSLEEKCFFHAGKAEDKVIDLCNLASEEELETVAIVDPPRAGLPKKVISVLRGNQKIESLIYVSCDSSNKMAQGNIVDLCKPSSKSLRGGAFRVVTTKPVDLFPQTPHYELVLLLLRGSSLERWSKETNQKKDELNSPKNEENTTEVEPEAPKAQKIETDDDFVITSSL